MSATESTGVDEPDLGIDALADPVVRDHLAAVAGRKLDRRAAAFRLTRRVLTFVVFVVLLALLYTGYKQMGEATDGTWPGTNIELPVATDDITMPPILDIAREFGEPLQRASDKPLIAFILEAAWFTLKEALAGFAAGVIIGMAIAIALLRSPLVERGVLPYVIVSQTVPLIAIAPMVVIWGRNFDPPVVAWEDWMSVAVIATYLTFFPVAVNGLRGLKSPSPASLELMDSYASSWWQTLWKVRLPASLPYLFPAFKLAATAAVVGAIVGEISAGVEGGLGRLILDFASRYITGPERLYAAVIGAALVGILLVTVISAIERRVLGGRPVEAT